MSYNLRIPTHKIDAIFGSAYPTLPLKIDQKCVFLTHVLGGITGCKVSSDFSRDRDMRVTSDGDSGKKQYDIDIFIGNSAGYDIASAVEKWVASVPKRKRGSLIRVCTRILRNNTPVDSYMIPPDNSFMVLTWLNDNCTVNDYQLYSKFGTDLSVGFKNAEHSTLFKLTFAGVIA